MSFELKSSFWSSLFVYIERPNLINNRLMGCYAQHCWLINGYSFETIYDFMRNCSLDQLKHKLKDCEQLSDFQMNKIKSIEGQALVVKQSLLKQSLKSLCSSDKSADNCREVIEFVLIDITNNQTVFVPKVRNSQIIPESCHKFCLNSIGEIELQYLSEDSPNDWLNEKVLPKLRQWMRQELEGSQVKGSLQLIGVDQYCLTYNTLKTRYANQMVELWRQYETTDPLKFVFEDIAIASYLIVLWKQQNQTNDSNRKQSFIDIGCGNGLLVYLLTMEGFRGLGIDLRKRNIWDKYEPRVNLVEKVFTPSDESVIFEGYDWLIGNHSDELTPWIPYIASNSSEPMNVFLLPCCPFDFNGSKYQRTSSNLSQYNCYIKYLQTICETLGFSPKTDKLRIPSTKRICIICDQRNYDKNCENDMKIKRKEFIRQKLNDFREYKPRDKVEVVRNCTRVPKDVLKAIVDLIANQLLTGNTNLTIGSVHKLLNNDLLSHLKSQCGGIQTLLRNHKHIFEVKNGLIGFSQPKSIETNDLDFKTHLKSKQCWFYHNHPNGCPLPDLQCRYVH